jgi:DNA topoisomerase-1
MIVESPAKAKTIGKFLGSDYKILASMGHVRDLPIKKLGINVEKDFTPEYVIPQKAKKVIAALQDALKGAEGVYLATDLDREGEAIAWHLKHVLKPKVPTVRITFHEISKSAIEHAILEGRDINEELVEAQAARRILDRLVGYTLSPFLWRKVAAKLSAGRVQSVTVRLVVEKEREIRNFKPVEYWSLTAILKKAKDALEFGANLISYQGKNISKLELKEELAKKLEKELEKAKFIVQKVEKKDQFKSPSPAFTTSTLQQEANRKLGYSAKKTMTLAQHLYEDGLITYMRTDSVQISRDAMADARSVIEKQFGKEYLPASARAFTNRAKRAQEAHEAIRPVKLEMLPKGLQTDLDSGHTRLYELIWKRTIASQMVDAKFERTVADIVANECIFRATGQIPVFAGFLKAYQESKDEADEVEVTLPELAEKDLLNLVKLLSEQHFTEPPARFTEATLVKKLEELSIGRPSTYAPTLETIQNRLYVELEEKKFKPTVIGELVTDLLVEHFPTIIDYQFTAEMEDKLDDIASGKRDKVAVLKEFYGPYAKLLSQKDKELKKSEIVQEETDKDCPMCNKKLVIKMGRYGKFYACSGYPDCDYTDKIIGDGKSQTSFVPENVGRNCPKCNSPLVKRKGRFGFFVGCSTFPTCKYIEQGEKEINAKCPKCGGDVVERRTRKAKVFWGCSNYPKCDYATWEKPDKK